MDYKIYSIVYKDGQDHEFDTYDNSHIKTIEQRSYLFEYNPIIDVIDNYNISSEYLGVFSWKFPLKTTVFKKKIDWIFENSNYDVYNFCRPLGENYMTFSERYHPGLLNLLKMICDDLGIVFTMNVSHAVYSNFFVCKTEVYKDYVNNYIKPAIELLETKYKDLAWRNANYVSDLNSEQFKQYTGLDYYPMHTFVLERLFSIYLENNKDLKVFDVFKNKS